MKQVTDQEHALLCEAKEYCRLRLRFQRSGKCLARMLKLARAIRRGERLIERGAA